MWVVPVYSHMDMLSCVQFFATLWTIVHQASLSMGFSRQEYWSGLPCLPPGDLLNPGIEPASLMSLVLAGASFTASATWETLSHRSLKVEGEPQEGAMVGAGPVRCSIAGFDDGGRGSWNKEWWWPLEAVTKQGNEFSLTASRRKVALSTLIFA